jgi:hypothetical protein
MRVAIKQREQPMCFKWGSTHWSEMSIGVCRCKNKNSTGPNDLIVIITTRIAGREACTPISDEVSRGETTMQRISPMNVALLAIAIVN